MQIKLNKNNQPKASQKRNDKRNTNLLKQKMKRLHNIEKKKT